MALHIKALSDNPYSSLVCGFLSQAFPANLDNQRDVVDAVTAAFLASSQTRFGPAPTPEGQVELRNVIRYWQEHNAPIVVMVPWGSKKTTNASSIDIAELVALKQVIALNDRVKRFYEPGIIANLRIENLGGRYLWRDEGSDTIAASDAYVLDLERLIRVLDVPFILPVKESDKASKEAFDAAADDLYPHLVHAIAKVVSTYMPLLTTGLADRGWIGALSPVMLNYYLDSYTKLYPHLTPDGRINKLAAYFAQSGARYRVGANGVAHPEWTGHFTQVNFATPVPGIPDELARRRLFYRTLPLRFAKSHMPPWRAKGYFRVSDDGGSTQVRPKLASWNDPAIATHEAMTVELSNGNERVEVRADLAMV